MASYLSVLIQAAEPANYKLNYDEHYMISVPLATTTTPGIVSFDSDYFKVTNGVVTLSDEYAGELSNIVDRLDGIDDDITDLNNKKVDKIVPANIGIYAYVVQKNSSNEISNYSINIVSGIVVPWAIPRYTASGSLKVNNAETTLDAVNLGDLEDATTNIPETALSVSVRTKLNEGVHRVGISPEAWEALPDADKDINTMYFVGPYGTAPNQYFVEWMYFVDTDDQGHWEAIGSTQSVDFSNYYNKTDIDNMLSNYYTKLEMTTKLSDYAKQNGYYPTMRVGLADQIYTEREINDADEACPPIVFGTVGGEAEVQSGLNKFSELRGHTIKWNQICKDPTFATASMWFGDETTISNNKAVMTGKGTQSQNMRGQYVTNEFPLVYGHTYLFALKVTTTSATTNTQIRVYDGSAFSYPFAGALSVGTTYIKSIFKFVKTSTQNGHFYFYPNLVETGFPLGETMTLENLQIIDLTEIYGEGNEPSTGAEFVRDFPMPVYQYNAGTLLSSKSASVDFVKRNQCPALDSFFNVLPNTEYEVSGITAGGYLQEFDGNKTLIKTSSEITTTTDITLTAQTVYAKIQATTYTDVLCYINWETPNLPYVPYSKQTITLPNIELRSVGDVYDVAYQTGGGKRRIGERAYQSGDENDPDVLTDGTTTLYVLATETDITLEENPGWDEYAEIDNFGTVKFNQSPAQTIPVPQAYFIRYVVNLVEFLDSLFVRCGGDVSKIALVE